jgi:hypothetical protein
VSVRPSSCDLKHGPVDVLLDAKNAAQLSGQRKYNGELKIKYPTLSGHVIQGPTSVAVVYQEQELSVDDVRPEDGTTFAARQKIVFLVNTLQTAKVIWDFGDGNSDTGHRVEHAYNTAVKPTVKVTVQAGGQEVAKEINLEVVDVGVTIDPVEGQINEGIPHTFTCTSRGGVTRCEWIVEGREFQGKGEKGQELTYTFNQAGKHELIVKAVHPKIEVESPLLTIDVIAKPGLTITEPLPDSELTLGQKVTFNAEVAGPVESVAWSIAEKDDSEAAYELETPVIDVGGFRKIARLDYAFAETSKKLGDGASAVVTAMGKLAPEVKGAPPTDDLPVKL